MQFNTKYNVGDLIENPQDSRMEEIVLIRIVHISFGHTAIEYKTVNSDWIMEHTIILATITKGEK
jgi:hypothetical protein